MENNNNPNKKRNFSDKISKHYNWFSRNFVIMLFSTLLGAICGLVMVGFNYLLILFKISFSFLPYFLGPFIAGALTSLIVRWGIKRNMFLIMGTGASEFTEEVNEKELLYNRFPILLGKTLATSWTFGSGMVCGKEGPGLLIGANLGHLFAKKFRALDLDLTDYYFIGASACTSAILRIPISGSLFCAELPYSNHIRYRSLIPSMFASIIAFLIFSLFFEFKPLIITNLSRVEKINYISLLPLLIFFGIFAGIFSLLLIKIMVGWMNKMKNSFKGRTGFWMLPLIGGGFYSIFLFIIIPFLDPNYYEVFIGPDVSLLTFFTKSIEKMNYISLLILIILFLIAIFFSIGFYNSAGLILPLMLLGALLGGLFGVLFYPEYPELFVLLGISAVLGASINNPITAIIIIIELTWEPLLFIPAGIVVIIAYIFSGPNAIIPGQRYVKKMKTIND